jgi:NAD(P)H-hydrate epimerase
MPGRAFTGDTIVSQIGIGADVLDEMNVQAFANAPTLWLSRFPWPAARDHKYGRGHALIAGGATMTGAARLATVHLSGGCWSGDDCFASVGCLNLRL